MANSINNGFNLLDDDDLFDLFRQPTSEILSNNVNESSNSYENTVVQNINSSSNELTYNLDFDRDVTQNPSSEYVTESQFKNIIKDVKDDVFSLLHMNIRSLKKHFDELQLLLDSPNKHPFSIIGLTETWLSSDTNIPYGLSG